MSAFNEVSSLFRVDGLVAVVTGGGTGIGLMIANALDANGAKAVYIVGRREEGLRKAAAAAVNGTLIPVVGDVSSADSLKAVASRVQKEQGYVNALVANAGVDGFNDAESLMGNKRSAKEFVDLFWNVGMADMTNTQHVNVTGSLFTAFAFLELLVAGNKKGNLSQKSQIITTTSVTSFMKSHPSPGYIASKAALAQVSKWMTSMFAPYDVRVNSIAPGLFVSDMSAPYSQSLVADSSLKSTDEGSISKDLIPAGRFGTEAEMSGIALFLLAKAGGYMNGETIVIDGGFLSKFPATH